MTDLKLAAAYIRVSTDDQAELSPETQLEVIRAYAEKNGYIILADYVFTDEGISGRKAKNRPGFNQLIAMAKSEDHPFQAILVWKFARFARNQEESIFYKAMLRRCGVDVISVSEPLIDGPFGSLIERIIEWMDEYYSIRLSGEVKRSMTHNATKGVRQTAPPFGYTRGPEGGPFMVPEPGEAAVIRKVFNDFSGGIPVWKIARDLNEAGVRTHRGGLIENRTINYWVQNPVYIGKNRWTPTGRTRRDFSNPDTIIVQGDHDPLVTEDVFQACQEVVRRNSAKYRPKSRPNFELKDWMSGIVRCAACGETLVLQGGIYFICNGHIRGKCLHRQMIRSDALHAAVIEKLQTDLLSSAPLRFSMVSKGDGSLSEIQSMEQQLLLLDRKAERIRDAYAAGIDTLEDYRKFKQDIDDAKAVLRSRIEQLRSEFDTGAAETSLRDAIRSALDILISSETTLAEKNDAARELFEQCTWEKDTSTLTITYRVFI